jgi:hypothetical protein
VLVRREPRPRLRRPRLLRNRYQLLSLSNMQYDNDILLPKKKEKLTPHLSPMCVLLSCVRLSLDA